MLELLAPAGDFESFYAAINCGADAVYLGLSDFNARMKANNFDAKNIKKAVKYAHLYGVKVFVTINIVLQENEFNQLISLVKGAVEAKVDAFIVQDLGVVKILKQCFPNIVLHASTQMGVHNLYGAKQLEKMGIERVVLSRETKLEDIKLIKDNTNLEIEFFVHGALCVAFSGNCYLSSIEKNASGNRGLCKQLCRFEYNANYNGKEDKGYLFSARDLCLIKNLKELVEAGVTSFKIEGRLRRSGYVAVAVSEYRKAIDNLNKTKQQIESEKKLKKVFNRGEFLSRAYLDFEQQTVVEKKYNNHIGIEAGKVLSVKPFKNIYKIEIYSKYPINKGDGLKFFDSDKEVSSLGVGSVQNIAPNRYLIFSKTKVKEKLKCNIILDYQLEQNILSNSKKNPITIKIEAYAGSPLLMHASSKSVSVSLQSDFLLEVARNAPITFQDFKNLMLKTADSNFKISNQEIYTDNVFCSKSKLNEMRRLLYLKLQEAIILSNEKNIKTYANNKAIEFLLKENITKNNDEQKMVLNYFYQSSTILNLDKNDIIVICPNQYNEKTISQMLNNSFDNKKALLLPNIANCKDIEIIDMLLDKYKDSFEYLVVQNLYGLKYAKDFKIIAGQLMNTTNSYAVKQLKNLQVDKFVKSFESNSNILKNVIIQKNYKLPLMTFSHCPYKTLYSNECQNCKAMFPIIYRNNQNQYKLEKIKIANCYFNLYKI